MPSASFVSNVGLRPESDTENIVRGTLRATGAGSRFRDALKLVSSTRASCIFQVWRPSFLTALKFCTNGNSWSRNPALAHAPPVTETRFDSSPQGSVSSSFRRHSVSVDTGAFMHHAATGRLKHACGCATQIQHTCISTCVRCNVSVSYRDRTLQVMDTS